MKKNIIGGLSAAVLSLTLLGAAPVYAMDQADHKKGHCIMQKVEQLKESLALTADQEKQLKALKHKHKAFMKAAHQEKQAIHKEARAIAEAKTMDQAKLDKLADRAGKLASKKLKERVMAKHEVGQILDQKQKDLIKKARKDMKKNMKQKKAS
ncbi:MAG: periplasmic heavy metal sensor [Legionella sp.]|nr:periplasmic heavy metal sensor [Legionella sp.]